MENIYIPCKRIGKERINQSIGMNGTGSPYFHWASFADAHIETFIETAANITKQKQKQ